MRETCAFVGVACVLWIAGCTRTERFDHEQFATAYVIDGDRIFALSAHEAGELDYNPLKWDGNNTTALRLRASTVSEHAWRMQDDGSVLHVSVLPIGSAMPHQSPDDGIVVRGGLVVWRRPPPMTLAAPVVVLPNLWLVSPNGRYLLTRDGEELTLREASAAGLTTVRSCPSSRLTGGPWTHAFLTESGRYLYTIRTTAADGGTDPDPDVCISHVVMLDLTSGQLSTVDFDPREIAGLEPRHSYVHRIERDGEVATILAVSYPSPPPGPVVYSLLQQQRIMARYTASEGSTNVDWMPERHWFVEFAHLTNDTFWHGRARLTIHEYATPRTWSTLLDVASPIRPISSAP